MAGRAIVVIGIAAGVLGCTGWDGAIEDRMPVTRSYVLASIRLEASDGTRGSGVDLDGLDSTGVGATCADQVADLESVRDPGSAGSTTRSPRTCPTCGSW